MGIDVKCMLLALQNGPWSRMHTAAWKCMMVYTA
jgi:hypothetical protein